jgi:perosamine synthetase
MAAIEALAGKHGLAIIEDAAEAHGAECRMGNGEWRRAGSFGALSIFSFYANKIVTTGEGGMVLTDDPALAERVRGYRNLFFGERNRFTHTELGFNFRLTNLQAALGLAQTERIDELVERKRWMGREYTARLADCAGIQLPAEAPWARNVYWMYGLLTTEQSGLDGAALARALDERGIQTRPFFTGMHRQPALRERGLFAGETYPVTERLARMGLYLPSGLALSEDQLETVAKAVRDIVG